ncbi:MAG: CDP-diacylglycerol--glycerol-3-phosphate 3-phosphatidyltransferase [Gloeocapsa sp. DLM2.Bin57]|nr:MAG: CDP-diacylglycerol--glycerol-3-phosphate 3-phosphatidyltransferase [Gloeocapsa sp. DLM2.Bin57]
MNLPNSITLSRLLGIPFIIYFLHDPTSSDPQDLATRARYFALAIFLVTAATDWLDGYLARKLNQVTELGKFLDPLVDKLLVIAPLLALVELNQIPAWGVFLIIGREIAIAGWRVNPQLSNSNQISGASIWGKLKTVTQIGAIALLIAPLPIFWSNLAIVVFWLAVALTLISGLLYLQDFHLAK